MGGLRDMLSRLGSRKSRARKRAGRVEHSRLNRFRRQQFEPLEERHMLAAIVPLSETFTLHSNPTATKTIYLDFDGHTTSGTTWNTQYNGGADFVTPWFSTDSDPGFSTTELELIQDVYQRVAEDFLPFNVDVTTQQPDEDSLKQSTTGGDDRWGVRVCVGGSSYDWLRDAGDPIAGAIALEGSFNWPSDTPAYVFTDDFGSDGKTTADGSSWTIGRSLGLNDDGTSSANLYTGHGTGPTSWAPIMGFAVSCELSQWSRGEYPDANNTEDDLALITGGYSNEYGTNGFGYRPDDVSDTVAGASSITMTSLTEGEASGIIGTSADLDVFSFITGPGAVSINVTPAALGPNLDILATLYNADGLPIATSNPVDTLDANFATTLTAGTYYVSVQGTGKDSSPGDPGYSDYGSLGAYAIDATLRPIYGVTIAPLTGLQTTEAGTTALFTMVLDAAPTANVTISLTSNDLTEGTISDASVIFNTTNWYIPKTITVTGVNDFVDDGDVTYLIQTGATQSTDAHYRTLTVDDVTVTNLDNDTAGFAIIPLSGLSTSENGATATFTVALTSQPTANVTLGLQSGNPTEGERSTGSLTFTDANWSTPQTVTVTGLDDTVVDGPVVYQILTARPTSTDSTYAALTAAAVPDVTLTNVDNDAGFVVSRSSGLVTGEDGATDTFTVMPSFQPSAPVTVTLSSSNLAEGRLAASTFVFSPANWNQAQVVTVIGVDDNVADGGIPYQITGSGTSTDTRFAVATPAVSATNNDNDTAGFLVTPTSGLQTSEQAGRATFTVRLTSQPLADVTLGLSALPSGEGTISTSSLLFTAANWNVDQTVTITGVNDNIDDGDAGYTIITAAATSADALYNGRNPSDVSVTNIDDDDAAVIVSRTSGLVTAEYVTADTFTVRLATQPTASVTINLASDTTTEGTVLPVALTFTTANWMTPQTVTVRGVDDAVDDGDQLYNITLSKPTSTDAKYSALSASSVQVTNIDNEGGAFRFENPGGMTTTEAGGTAVFTVRLLNVQPATDVTLNLASSDLSEGTIPVSSLVFTHDNWDQPQTVTVTGVDDIDLDGNIAYSIQTSVVSTDAAYISLNPADLAMVNADNDTATVMVSPTAGLVTSEAGSTASFTVRLSNPPTAPVTVYLTPGNANEGRLSADSVVFTAANWNVPQPITVTGRDDLMADGDVSYTILVAPAGSADPKWNGVDGPDVGIKNTDNDTAGVTVSPTSLEVNENGTTGTFTVVLTSQPVGTFVNIGISSDDTTEGTVSTALVTFNKTNWNVPQTVTVTGASDSIIDSDQTFHVVTAAALSDGGDYSGRDAANVTVVNRNIDTARVVITPTSGLATTEAGGVATFTVQLASIPATPVSFSLSSNDTTEGTLAKRVTSITRSGALATVTLAGHGLANGATVVIDGADQAAYNGTVTITVVDANTFTYSVAGSPATPATGPITAKNVRTVTISRSGTVATVTSISHGYTVGSLVQISGATPAAYNGIFRINSVLPNSFTYTVLGSPTSPASGTITASLAGLTFTSANWNTPQTVTVTGLDDPYQDDDISYQIVTGSCVTLSTTDPYYNLAVDDVVLVNRNDDRIEIRTSPTTGVVTRETDPTTTATSTFEVWLGSMPTADVTVSFSSTDPTEGTVLTTQLIWAPADWQVRKTVTIAGLDDLIDDGNVSYQIQCTATSTDTAYNNNASNPVVSYVGVQNLDDADTAGITVVPPPVAERTTYEWGSTLTFTVVLNSQPVGDVVVPINSSNTAEGVPSVTSLRFTAANWNIPQTVTITGQDDFKQDLVQNYAISIGPAVSSDTVYSGLQGTGFTLQNVNLTPVAAADGYSADVVRSVTQITRSGSTVTLSATGHGFSTGQSIVISGAEQSEYNGTFAIRRIDADTFTYTIATTPASPATGTITAKANATLVVVGPGVLANDYDSDGGPASQLTAVLDSGPTYYAGSGAFALSPTGGFTYVGPEHFAGTDSFTYQVRDGQGAVAQTTVTITIGSWVGDIGIAFNQKVWEGQGTVAGAGTVSRLAGDPATDALVVYLSSPDDDQITVPQSVTIPAGQPSATFSVTVIDDALFNGRRNVDVWASAVGYRTRQASLEIGDNELHHFTFAQIVGPKIAGVSFAANLWARDINDEAIENYAGAMVLSAAGTNGGVSLTTDSQVFDKGKYTFNAAVNALATGVKLTATDGAQHTGTSTAFDVVHGDLAQLRWTSDPLAYQHATTAFPVQLAAYDNHNYPITDLSGTVTVAGWVSTGATSSLVISEIADKNGFDDESHAVPDFIELQNVGTSQVSTWSWQLLANDPEAGLNVFQSRILTDVLALNPGDTVMISDDAADADLNDNDYYFDAGLNWGQGTGKGWVMLVDQNQNLVDFLVWGYSQEEIESISVAVGSNTLKPAGTFWLGDGVGYDRTEKQSLQRIGSHDCDQATDFAWTKIDVTRPSPNANLSTAFGGVWHTVALSATTKGFVNGVLTAQVTVDQAVENMFLVANGMGFTVIGQPFDVGAAVAAPFSDTITLVDPAASVFYVRESNSGGFANKVYGYGAPGANWIPLSGDWNGDNKNTAGMYDPASSCFYLTNSDTGGMAQITFGFGQGNAGWLPLVGDWNGDGVDTIGLYDPKTATFHLTNKNQSGFADASFGYGETGSAWTPLAGDWNGDGIDTVGLYAPTASVFYLRNANTTGMADYLVAFGQGGTGWKPVVGDWNADYKVTIGIYDPASGTFYLRDSNTSGFADHVFGYGPAPSTWTPLAGDWNGANTLLAASLGDAGSAAVLAATELTASLETAVAQWSTLGLDADIAQRLAQVEVVVTDLPGTELGRADGDRIYLDATAADHGWFVDSTPDDNLEFDAQLTAVDPQAVDRVDLLTVVAHELAHLAGLEHLESGLMEEILPAGMRRLAGLAERDALFANGLADDES